ncbi:hypothetical protein DVJ83_15345 (plasmid) [Deinococcus wulumuqiensis]|uniref:Uncharacterized protein n=1 Tax=Deinococcus wulumuqiensis TaxID=980427 RepID=A0A345ILH9_9DEIO|nr:hypothetical protein DVJ83_15345 [Deinococcus wulumuqiensis]
MSRDRVVYEVRGPQRVNQVDATSTSELKNVLTPLLGLNPYSTQAVAHLAHVERATVQGDGWSIRRLGVLAFVPDSEAETKPAQRSRSPQKNAGRQVEDDQVQEPADEQLQTDAPQQNLQTVQDTLL